MGKKSIKSEQLFLLSSLYLLIITPAALAQDSELPELEFWQGTAADLVLEEEQATIIKGESKSSEMTEQELSQTQEHFELPTFNSDSLTVEQTFIPDNEILLNNPELEPVKSSVLFNYSLTDNQYLIIEDNELDALKIAETSSEIEINSDQDLPSDTNNSVNTSSWDFKVQPYYTIPWKVTGQATVQGITVDLDLGLGDLLDTIQAYANTRFEAWNGRWGIIVDASYWSFSGIGDFGKPLQVNDKIQERIREDLAVFTDQTIDTVGQLIDREQEFFNQFQDAENSLANQLINQEIEAFRQGLIDEINESQNNNLSFDRDRIDPLDEINLQQIQVSDRLSNGLNLLQSLNDLHNQLLNQTLTLRDSSLPFSENNQDRLNDFPERSSSDNRNSLENIKETLDKIRNQTELVDVTLPNIAGRLDSQPSKVSERLQDSFDAAQEIKDLQEELIDQALKLKTNDFSTSAISENEKKLKTIEAVLEKIEEQVKGIDSILPNDIVLEDFAENKRDEIDQSILDNVDRIREVRNNIDNLQQKLGQVSEGKERIEDFRDSLLEEVSDLQVDLFRSLLNITEYSQQLRQEINELEQKLEEVIQDIEKLQEFRERILEAKLLLEIEIFQDLIAAEIELFEAFDQRIDQGFSKIYDETIMILEDLQSFHTVLDNAESDVDNFELIGDLSLDYSQGTYDFALSYHFGQFPIPYNPDGKDEIPHNFPLLWFEPIAGVRLNDFYLGISADISYQFDGDFIDFEGDFQESFIEKRTWFEPLLGGKLGLQVSPPVILWLRGDVSGFGLAGDTNLTWNFFAGLDWWVSPRTSILFAYRFYRFDYGLGSGRDRNELNINFNGPTLGVSYHF